MSLQLKDVKSRITTTQSIRKVTTALQRIASANLAKERRRMIALGAYAEETARILRAVCSALVDNGHPLMTRRPRGSVAVLVFGADRGLCGGFNAELMAELRDFSSRHYSGALEITAVGRDIGRRAERAGLTVTRRLPHPHADARDEFLQSLVAAVRDDFLSGGARQVHVLFTQFISGLAQVPVITQILPVVFATSKRPRGDLGFEPSPAFILDRLLTEFIELSILQAFQNSIASENAARQAAMSRASENAGQVITELGRTYRRLRQESVTREMLELVGGNLA